MFLMCCDYFEGIRANHMLAFPPFAQTILLPPLAFYEIGEFATLAPPLLKLWHMSGECSTLLKAGAHLHFALSISVSQSDHSHLIQPLSHVNLEIDWLELIVVFNCVPRYYIIISFQKLAHG